MVPDCNGSVVRRGDVVAVLKRGRRKNGFEIMICKEQNRKLVLEGATTWSFLNEESPLNLYKLTGRVDMLDVNRHFLRIGK